MTPDAQTNNMSYAQYCLSIQIWAHTCHLCLHFVQLPGKTHQKRSPKSPQRSPWHCCVLEGQQSAVCWCRQHGGTAHTLSHSSVQSQKWRAQTIFSCHSNQLLSQHNFDATSDMVCRTKHAFVVTKLLSLQKLYWWQLLPMTVESLHEGPSWTVKREHPLLTDNPDSALKVNSSAMIISQLASSALVLPRCTIHTASQNMPSNQVLPPPEHVWFYWNEANQV